MAPRKVEEFRRDRAGRQIRLRALPFEATASCIILLFAFWPGQPTRVGHIRPTTGPFVLTLGPGR